MQNFLNWLDMGGYSLYVWSSYGCALAVLAMHGFSIRRAAVKIKKRWQNDEQD